jgi:putative phosphotransacetylase
LDTDRLIAAVTEAVVRQLNSNPARLTTCTCSSATVSANDKISVGVSNRHVHLSAMDLQSLFGSACRLTVFKQLSQPGQFASEQKVILAGPGGLIENVRVLGPTRSKTQVEITAADGYKLGLHAPVRESGDLNGSSAITLIGSAGVVALSTGAIVAARHIHMHTKDAARFGKKDGDRVSVQVPGPRGLVFNEVLIRVSAEYALEMHIDVDEANAASLRNGDAVYLSR